MPRHLSRGGGGGIDGERSGMWREMARIIHEVRPRFVFVENSSMLTSRGLGRVLGDLASMGFDAKWGVLGANDIGANHQRDRIWIRAEQMGNSNNDGQTATEVCSSSTQRSNTSSTRQEQTSQLEGSGEQYAELAYTNGNRLHGGKTEWDRKSEWPICENQSDNGSEIWSEIDRCSEFGSKEEISNTQAIGLQRQGQHEQSVNSKKSCQRETNGLIYGRSPDFWSTEPNVGRVAHGVASRVDRIKAIGNGQVPLCAATAWRILK